MRAMFITIIFTMQLFGQQPVKQDPTLFDFWVGEWDLTWKDPDGSTASGRNLITKILDGKVIQENFTGLTGQSKGYKGQSNSLLDNRTGVWMQTWVDNQSSYLPFTGGAEGANRFFEHEFMKDGKLHRGKMIFRNITKDAFVWGWMKSIDNGKTWNIEWSINYQRIK
ncbi:MAG: hypothetical protein WDA22_13870 [Bacteroidota bacterium]